MSNDKINLGRKFTERELIAGISGKSSKVERSDALLQLSESNSKKKERILSEVVVDKKQPYKMRLLAINEMARNPTSGNKKQLLDQLKSKDDRILSKTVKVLGEMGDESDLAALRKLKVNSSSFVAKKLDFAKKLIAYRSRSAVEKVARPSSRDISPINRKKSRTLRLSAFPKQNIKKSLDPVMKRIGSTELSEKLVTRLQCGHEEMILSFAKGFDSKSGLQSLSKKNGIPLVMLKKRGCPEEYFVSHYFFATPTGKSDEVEIQGIRPNGVITYSGKMNLGKTDAVCSLQGVKNIYDAAVDLEVVINHEEQYIKANKALSETTINRKLNPYKIPTPASQ